MATANASLAMFVRRAVVLSAAAFIVFWNKGNTAVIEESGKTTYSGCTTGR